MYQTLQQSLKKFQAFLEKWSTSSSEAMPIGMTQDGLRSQKKFAQEETSQKKLAQGESPNIDPALDNKNPSELTSDSSLMHHFNQIQQLWIETQKQLEEATPHPYGQALNTEIHKQFRLMEIDIRFLQSARQPTTFAQRKRKLGDRLNQLIDYCETGIKLRQQKPGEGT